MLTDALSARPRRGAARRVRRGEGRDEGVRHPARQAAQDLRAVLHHQAHRRGNRPRPLDGLRHRQADRRLYLRRQRGWPRHHVLALFPGTRRARAGRRPGREPTARLRWPRARGSSCWSRTRRRSARSPAGRCGCAATPCSRPRTPRRRSDAGGRDAQRRRLRHRRGDARNGRAVLGEDRARAPARHPRRLRIGLCRGQPRGQPGEVPNSVFLPKPFSLKELTETVHAQITRV